MTTGGLDGTVGAYRLLRKLGEGGMGVVWAARDERLGREVALKLVRPGEDGAARERFWREARAAAGVSHPNVCQIFDVGEDASHPYLAMELLAGESLEERIARGAIPTAEAVEIALGVLDALAALHAGGLLHRDLKPSNVFLTPHGPKLVDFGLALPFGERLGGDAGARLTLPGTLVGTPRYMAPEQWRGETLTPATDVFAAGALLFEMLTGRPAFAGDSVGAIFQAVLTEQPPALAGAGAAGLDAVLQRALAKRVEERHPDAAAMGRELRRWRDGQQGTRALAVQAVTRILVMPFRVLRPDPEVDFLATALPDAITAALASLRSVVVRSSAVAARYAGPSPDLRRIATEAEVDLVLLGSLLAAGSRLRLSTELVEAHTGTVLWSHVAQATTADVFALQDELAERVVGSLGAPLAGRDERSASHDLPATPHAYELYLRGNGLGGGVSSRSLLVSQRDLYRAALDEDASFAPAWARLGRVYRVMAKYGHAEPVEALRLAEEAFRRALELSPGSPVAHHLYTYLEIESGRAPEAMVRLLGQVRRGAVAPELFAGLVTALRFCGLLDASLAAHARARRLDPAIATSVGYTHSLRGESEEAIRHDFAPEKFVTLLACIELGRVDEALAGLARLEPTMEGNERQYLRTVRAAATGDAAGCEAAARDVLASSFQDPEGFFALAREVARIDLRELALDLLARAVEGGFCAPDAMRQGPLARLAGEPRFASLRDACDAGRRRAAGLYREAGGPELLGVAG